MDQYYDKNAARALLVRIITERAEQCPTHLQVIEYSHEDGIAKDAQPIQVSRPRCWKFATPLDDQGMQEELVLRIQGIICDRNLPPIKKPQTIAIRERRYKHQSVMLTGFGSDKMETCIKGIQVIFRRFEDMLSADALEKWTPALFDGHSAIDMGNRFFTSRHDQSNHEMVSFKQSVDPDGILEGAMELDFVHLRENEVEYFEHIDDGKDGKSYNVIDPSKLSKGDIVEAQISFLAVPIKNKKYKPLVVLRAITLLDVQPSKDTLLKRSQKHHLMERSIVRPSVLKRRVGYMQDEVEAMEPQMKRMKMVIG